MPSIKPLTLCALTLIKSLSLTSVVLYSLMTSPLSLAQSSPETEVKPQSINPNLQTARETHQSTSTGSYGVNNIIPDWTPDLREEDTKLKAQKGDFVAVPVPIADPTIGTGLVIAGAYYYGQTAAEKAVQPASTTQAVAAYTDNDSYAYGLMQQNYWDEDKWRFTGAAAYVALKLTLLDSKYTQSGKGLDWNIEGTLLKGQLLRNVGENWFVGGQVRLINNEQTFSSSGEGQNIEGNTEDEIGKAKANGVGALIQYDTRDNQTNAYSGQRFEFDAMFNDELLGSSNTYQSYLARYRYYYHLFEPLVLAFEARGCAKYGNAPLWDYCTVGLRGFSATKYLNKASSSGQIEARWKVFGDFGLVGFAGGGFDSHEISELWDNDMIRSYGMGIRYMVLDSQRINLRLDYARSGDNDAIYVSVAEAF
ncbi:outer membrane protein assembly factor [Shewanella eurypsychrophilus]|uniref:Outer membrane protein assembly factor n=1 Tax=Shewanella eurypsychrophilus TaxID=2593656 RepID=A0ABX6VAD9_9GAMM|nr:MULTISPECIES: BamA/TamA family outer membrane protein [Shewanella]QFU23618.1 BamA/TamA family outer membrane protein [Shewanella sp. YLB-09]QPG58841.1 outer membrane protein assembly factor [Shewanella eurypsychrophilus]